MNDYDRCKVCGLWGFMRSHKCPPAWECVAADAVSYADEEDIWHTVYAVSAREAAEKFSAWSDRQQAEYADETEVAVRQDADGPIEIFSVEFSTEPVYTARRKDTVPIS